jgi:hypothetical protein
MNKEIIDLMNKQKQLSQKLTQKDVEYVLHHKNGRTQVWNYTRKKYISNEMISEMKKMLEGKMLRKDICQYFNISMPTLKKYVG